MSEEIRAYTYENISYWTKRASGYSEVNKEELATRQKDVWTHTLSERIAEHFGNRRPEELRVLDIGTGPGFFAIILAELGYQVTAVDYTEAMLEQARENAGEMAERIHFQQMDAQALTFPSGSFDVVVSRNLTWNLRQPFQAYTHWSRVLKEGGLLLNFDANWYRYLLDEEARQAHLEDRENVQKTQAPDDTAGTDVDAMEAIAWKAPLTAELRPGWDIRVLDGLGMKVSADADIWKQVWTDAERINNSSTPMFLVHAEKLCHSAEL